VTSVAFTVLNIGFLILPMVFFAFMFTIGLAGLVLMGAAKVDDDATKAYNKYKSKR